MLSQERLWERFWSRHVILFVPLTWRYRGDGAHLHLNSPFSVLMVFVCGKLRPSCSVFPPDRTRSTQKHRKIKKTHFLQGDTATIDSVFSKIH